LNFFSLFKRKILYKLKKKINIDLDSVDKLDLDGLFYHYGSDKSNTFKKTGDKGHGFSKFYEERFKNFNNKKINILEIGSYAGASAAAFTKFFPNSNIYCFDVIYPNLYIYLKIYMFMD